MPKLKPKRSGFVIDMTPLVDITFLLLTFFMFTAKFKSDAENEQKFVIERPKASADTSKLPEQGLATIKIAIDSVTLDTAYYFELSSDKDREVVYNAVTEIPAELKTKAQLKIGKELATLERLVLETRRANLKTKFAIDSDKKIRFKWVEDIMDIMQRTKATVFNFVTEKRQ